MTKRRLPLPGGGLELRGGKKKIIPARQTRADEEGDIGLETVP